MMFCAIARLMNCQHEATNEAAKPLRRLVEIAPPVMNPALDRSRTAPRRRHLLVLSLPLVLLCLVALGGARAWTAQVDPALLPAAATHRVDFIRDLQPILENACLGCHGPQTAKSQLRLDTREHALQGGENGPDLLPGESAKSPIVHFTARLVPDSEMPPEGRGVPLTPEQVGLLRAWIDQGALWPEGLTLKASDGSTPNPSRTAEVATDSLANRRHWAFQTPSRPPVPPTKNRAWPRNPIDHFILARLEKDKLNPSPEADRTTLIRRLSLDLIGLPPTVAEVRSFLEDKRPGAYERVVDRLLASPHYGERWARHWLDLARYADTNGYEKDRPRSIWPYRDWVIQAFNRDLPFDQFAIEQLAGDLLPNATLDQRVATGFLRNSMLNQEGGIEPEQFRVEALIDRMDTLGKSLLGLTINCCQCHDHKYDPFTQQEYYQLYAFLNSDDEAFLEVPSAEQQRQREQILGRVQALQDNAIVETKDLPERMAAWEQGLADAVGDWQVLDPTEWQNFATKFEKQDDRSLLGGGDLQPGSVMRVWVETQLTNITGFRLEALANPNLVYGGPGLTGKGTFLLKEFTVEASPLLHPIVTNQIRFKRALADQEEPGFGVAKAIDGNTDQGGWVPALTPDRRNQSHWAVFEADSPVGFAGGSRLLFTLHESFDGQSKLEGHMLGCLRLSLTTHRAPLQVDPLSANQRRTLAIAPDQRSSEQKRDLFSAFCRNDPGFAALNQQLRSAWTNWPYPPTTLALQARPQPRVTHLFKRGDRLRPAQRVEPAVPAVLPPLAEGTPLNRLGLAKWIVDPRHPTTARAAVNRLWLEYFGQGLVATPEDFGTRADRPSHPELLDWLAREFIDSGWRLKPMHRLIVTSAAYRQASRVTPDLYARDPYNRLLARAPRLRVEGEVVQDIALAASGLLNPQIGGPSIYPPIPGSVGDTVYGGFSWPETQGSGRFRRGLYTFWKRSLPFPSLVAFDAPTGETSCPRRVRSNTPLQALATLNETVFATAAQALALRVMKESGPDNSARAGFLFQLCTARLPTFEERRRLLAFWDEQYRYFEDRTATAITVAVPDPKQLPPEVNLHKLAAWAMVSRVVLNLDETITRE